MNTLNRKHFIDILPIQSIFYLLPVGEKAEPDEDVEDHSNGAGEVHGDGNWVEESKVDAVDTNKTESDQKIYGNKNKNWD